MKTLIYLHGFNSSPQSLKAQLTQRYFDHNSDIKLHIPALPPAPLEAIAVVQQLVEQQGRENLLGFVGSSLGGFYSLYLQHFYASADFTPKVALINPALRPYELLLDYLGENQNLYTGERYYVEPSHMQDLESLIVDPQTYRSTIYLLTQTGDEVLDFKQAVESLQGAKMWIGFQGSHAFDDYQKVLPSILKYMQAKPLYAPL